MHHPLPTTKRQTWPGVPGPGKDDDTQGHELLDFGHRNRIVALDPHLVPQLAELLREVVGEAIVVVEHQEHVTVPEPSKG
jgi:hypothetical protein